MKTAQTIQSTGQRHCGPSTSTAQAPQRVQEGLQAPEWLLDDQEAIQQALTDEGQYSDADMVAWIAASATSECSPAQYRSAHME